MHKNISLFADNIMHAEISVCGEEMSMSMVASSVNDRCLGGTVSMCIQIVPV